jgi:hypothetical protein
MHLLDRKCQPNMKLPLPTFVHAKIMDIQIYFYILRKTPLHFCFAPIRYCYFACLFIAPSFRSACF